MSTPDRTRTRTRTQSHTETQPHESADIPPAHAHTLVYAHVRQRLRENGVPIDTLDEVAADPYLRIDVSKTDTPRLVLLLTAAIVIRSVPELVTETFQIPLVKSDGTRVGYAYVSLEWIRAYQQGALDRIEYAHRVLRTYQSFDSNASGGASE